MNSKFEYHYEKNHKNPENTNDLTYEFDIYPGN